MTALVAITVSACDIESSVPIAQNGPTGGCAAAFVGAASSDGFMGINSRSWGTQVAQSFVARSASDVTTAQVALALSALIPSDVNFAGNLELSIHEDSFGSPFPDQLGQEAKLAVRTVQGTTPSFYRFNFPEPISLQQGTEYWIVVNGTYNIDPSGTYYIQWAGVDGDPYSDGSPKFYSLNANSWVAPSFTTTTNGFPQQDRDLMFKVGC